MHGLGCAHWDVHRSFHDVRREQGWGKKRDEALATSQEPGIAVLIPQHSHVEHQGVQEI